MDTDDYVSGGSDDLEEALSECESASDEGIQSNESSESESESAEGTSSDSDVDPLGDHELGGYADY
jgi:hypothetical protein